MEYNSMIIYLPNPFDPFQAKTPILNLPENTRKLLAACRDQFNLEVAKGVLEKNFANSQEKTSFRISILIKLQVWGLQFIEKDSGTGVFAIEMISTSS